MAVTRKIPVQTMRILRTAAAHATHIFSIETVASGKGKLWQTLYRQEHAIKSISISSVVQASENIITYA